MTSPIEYEHLDGGAALTPPDQEFGKSTVLGTLIGLLSVGLCVALLLLIVFPDPPRTAGGGGIGDAGEGSGYGDGVGDGIGTEGDGLAATDGEGDGYGGVGQPNENPGKPTSQSETTGASDDDDGKLLVADANENTPTRKPVVTKTEMSIAPLRPTGEQARTGGGGDTGDGEAGAGGSAEEKEFLGVKVRGSIALVCDVSGSMSSDFPILYRELRENFPKSTPLIMVPGCNFSAPNPTAAEPQKGPGIPIFIPVPGIETDPHVYMAQSTTDAIIYAVEKLKRRTVMFNNDLQDGGSESAIAAFQQLRRRRRFTLSGRSLNCNAPECLLKFIRQTRGDFKVDTISRSPAPARSWSP